MRQPRQAGRKPKHPNPLSNVHAVAAMSVLNKIRKDNGWSESETIRQVADAALSPKIQELDPEELGYAQFDFDPVTFKKVTSEDVKLNENNKWGIYLWMREYYGNDLKISVMEETLRQKEQLIHSFNKLFGYDELNTDIAGAIGGHYNLYRPFYSDPHERIIVQRLIVGEGDSIFNCTITGEYEVSPNDFVRDEFKGKIIPQGDRVAAVLRIPNNFRGSMSIQFDELDINSGGSEVKSMSGLMVTTIGNARSSAWPILADRVKADEPINHPIISRSEFGSIPAKVLEALDRGSVHWNAKHYPNAFSGPVA